MTQRIKVSLDSFQNPSNQYTYGYAGTRRTTPDTQCTGGVYAFTDRDADILRNGGTITGFNGVEFYADPSTAPAPAPAPEPERKKFLGIF